MKLLSTLHYVHVWSEWIREVGKECESVEVGGGELRPEAGLKPRTGLESRKITGWHFRGDGRPGDKVPVVGI